MAETETLWCECCGERPAEKRTRETCECLACFGAINTESMMEWLSAALAALNSLPNARLKGIDVEGRTYVDTYDLAAAIGRELRWIAERRAS